MTPVFCCGFECGQAGASGGTSGQHWNFESAVSFSTTTVNNGARSLRCNPSASSAQYARCVTNATGGITVARFYVRFATLPNSKVPIFLNGANTGSVVFNNADNKIYAGFGVTTGATGVLVTTGIWYRIDVKILSTGNPHTCDVQVDGTAISASNSVAANTSPASITVGDGWGVVTTADYFIDDFILSSTDADYPIGAGYINHFVPTSDGTHTATTTTILKGTLAAPGGGGNVAGSTDVFNWVNGVPLLGGATDNTRLVNQQTAGTGLYAEVKFGPAPGISTPTTAPRAVEAITADREAGASNCDFTAKLNDNGTEGTIVARGVVAGVVTDRYATKQFATGPAGAWTAGSSGAGAFNNIKARWGYASDATPDVYWRGIMIEAEFATIVTTIPNKIYQKNQAVNRASTY